MHAAVITNSLCLLAWLLLWWDMALAASLLVDLDLDGLIYSTSRSTEKLPPRPGLAKAKGQDRGRQHGHGRGKGFRI